MFIQFILIVSINILGCLTQTSDNCTNDGYVSTGSYCDECGLTDVTPNVRIVGGIEALPKSWPAQVLVVQNIKGDYTYPNGGVYSITKQYMCGGTLINRNTILTAAHCINDYFEVIYNNYPLKLPVYPTKYYPTLESTFKIYLGIFNISDLESVQPPVVVASVQKAIRHELYDLKTEINDIALLILNNSVNFNSYIKPACLPKPSNDYPKVNTVVYASGWGTLTSKGKHPDTLYNVNLVNYDPSMCKNVYPTINKNWNSQICAGNYSGYKDTCQGDSGGGLYVRDNLGNNPRFIVAGIVSYGDGCASYGMPGIYTRVSYYIDWISKKVNGSNDTVTTVRSTTSEDKTTFVIVICVILGTLIVIAIVVVAALICWRKCSKNSNKNNIKNPVLANKRQTDNSLRHNSKINYAFSSIEQMSNQVPTVSIETPNSNSGIASRTDGSVNANGEINYYKTYINQ